MTIFLTTQYLEEADELADRVGIMSDGQLVAEGTPEALKRSIGDDVIIARIDGEADAALAAVHGIDGVSSAELHGDELTIAATDGAGGDQPRGGGAERLRRARARTSRCAPPRSTTCSSSSPATGSSEATTRAPEETR